MTDTIQRPSLLPYLQPGPGKFYLMIGPESESALSSLEPGEDPFQLRDASDPFALLGHARIVSDLAQQVLPLFLLLQRSEYHCNPEKNRLSTNLSIDQRWQQILPVLSTPSFKTQHVLLAEQKGKQGQLLQFRSLFYCRAKQSFFHPPCPSCGKELIICTDDTLLSRHGLEGYSTSLRRFLYCPLCCSDGTADNYYVPTRTETDPDCVSDSRQLIKGWALLQTASTVDASLPCSHCPSNKACFGRNFLAVNTLCSFSFYPFYMVLLKAESEMSIDFQSLLSSKARLAEQTLTPESTPHKASERPFDRSEHIPKASISANAAIHSILADISARWDGDDMTTKQPPVTGKTAQALEVPFLPQKGDVDLMETVILGTTPISHNRGAAILGINEASPSSDFYPSDTVQFQPTPPERQPKKKESDNATFSKHQKDDLQETLILSPQPGQQVRGHLEPSLPPENTKGNATTHRQSPLANGKMKDVDPAETLLHTPGKKP